MAPLGKVWAVWTVGIVGTAEIVRGSKGHSRAVLTVRIIEIVATVGGNRGQLGEFGCQASVAFCEPFGDTYDIHFWTKAKEQKLKHSYNKLLKRSMQDGV